MKITVTATRLPVKCTAAAVTLGTGVGLHVV